MPIRSLLRALRARRAGVRIPGVSSDFTTVRLPPDSRVARAARAAAAEVLERRVYLTNAPAGPSFAFAKWAHDAPRTVSVIAEVNDPQGPDGLRATIQWGHETTQSAQVLDWDAPFVFAEHTFAGAGRHTVRLTVTDASGQSTVTRMRVASPDHDPRVNDDQLAIPPEEQQDPEAFDDTPFATVTAPAFATRSLSFQDTTPPAVAGVFLDGTGWTQATRDALAASGRGSATLGYAVPAGAGQLTPFPARADQVHVVFTEPVDVTRADLTALSVAGIPYPVNAFVYDPDTYTATWTLTLPQPMRDRMLLDLSDRIADAAGNRLDGEWAPGQEAAGTTPAFPSGDGRPGGEFQFHVNYLPADFNSDGIVNSGDLLILGQNYNQSPRSFWEGDTNGDGTVNFGDLGLLAQNYNLSLPAVASNSIQITGAGFVQTGGRLDLTAVLSAGEEVDPNNLVWSISKDTGAAAKTYATGTGQTFAFTPDEAGTYTATVTLLRGSSSLVATQTITVTSPAPAGLTIIGPRAGQVLHSFVYTAKAVGDLNIDAPTYDWEVKDGDGQVIASESTPYATFRFTPTLPTVEGHDDVLSLTVHGSTGASVSASVALTVSPEPSQPDTKTWFSDPQPGGRTDQVAEAAARQPDGKLVVAAAAGSTSQNLAQTWVIARYNADLSGEDPTFGDGGFVYPTRPSDDPAHPDPLPLIGRPNDVALQADGKIIAVGITRVLVNGQFRNEFAVIRLNSNGTPDTTFGSGGRVEYDLGLPDGVGFIFGAEARSVQIQGDGKIVVAGWSAQHFAGSTTATAPVFTVMRLNPDGSLDTTFGPVVSAPNEPEVRLGYATAEIYGAPGTPYEVAEDVLVQPDGGIVLGGWTTSLLSHDQPFNVLLMRFKSSGELDTNFGAGGFTKIPGMLVDDHQGGLTPRLVEYGAKLALQPDGKILVQGPAGNDPHSSSTTENQLLRVNPDGTLDNTFGTGGRVSVQLGVGKNEPEQPDAFYPLDGGLALQPDGRILVGDRNGSQFILARYNINGTPDDGSPQDSTHDDSFADAGFKYIDLPNHSGGSDADRYQDVLFTPEGITIVGGTSGAAGSDITIARYQLPYASVTGLVASATPEGPVDLQWVDASTGAAAGEDSAADGFGIERSVHGGAFQQIASVGAGTTTYRDEDVQPDTDYTYRVFAFRGNDRQGQSDPAYAHTAPQNLTYVLQETIVFGDDQVIRGLPVSSKTVLVKGAYYQIRASGNVFLGPATADFPDGKRADAEYGRWIPVPQDDNGVINYGIGIDDPSRGKTKNPFWGPPSQDSDNSYVIGWLGDDKALSFDFHDDHYGDNQIDRLDHPLQVQIYRALPGTPGRLTATVDRPGKKVVLNWQDVSGTEQYFQLQRSTDNGTTWSDLAQLPTNSTSFADGPLGLNARYSYRIRAHDAFGDSAWSNWAVAALVNQAPVVEPAPGQLVHLGQELNYQVKATDAEDGQAGLTYALTGPTLDDMSIGATDGFLHWTPTVARTDPVFIGVTVTDRDGASTTQFIRVVVSDPSQYGPTITSATATTASPSTATLSAAATSTGTADFGWSVVRAPINAPPVTFDVRNNTTLPTVATFGKAGDYLLRVTATDETTHLTTSQDVTYAVDQVPTAVSIGPAAAVLGQQTTTPFAATLFDQFGEAIAVDPQLADWTWGVSGAGISLVPFNPDVDLPERRRVTTGTTSGSYQVTAELEGVTGTANVTVRAQSDTPPTFGDGHASANPNPVTGTTTLLSAEAARDAEDYPDVGYPDFLTYTWSVTEQPAGVPAPTFDGNNGTNKGITTLASFGAPGSYRFQVTVADQDGQTVTSEVPVDVVETQVVVITPSSTSVTTGGTQDFTAKLVNQFGQSPAQQPTFDWTVESQGAGGTIVPSTDPAKPFTWVYTAPSSLSPITGGGPRNVLDVVLASTAGVPDGRAAVEVTESAAPLARITDPAPAGQPIVIDRDTPLQVAVHDANKDLSSWKLELVLQGGGTDVTDDAPILLASGQAEVGTAPEGGAQVAILHPTLFPSGLYHLVLTATDQAGHTSTDTRPVQVKTDLKLGNFTLPVTDMTVQTATGQITVTRVYDSAQANVPGDFGYGWRLDLNDTSLHTTARPSAVREPDQQTLRAGDLVYVTVPGRGQQVFEFAPKRTSQTVQLPFGSAFVYTPQFAAVDGTRSHLDVDMNANVGVDADHPQDVPLTLIQDGDEFYDDSTGLVYNPARWQFGQTYTLTTQDGAMYTIDALNGKLQSSQDANGNVTTYSPTGVNADGLGITIQRDASTRITSITDAKGKTVNYYYATNGSGDLDHVTDRAGNITKYAYDTARPHFLTKVIDPRGVTPLTVAYDAEGRLASVKDAYGHTAPTTGGNFDGTNARSSITDLAKNDTEFVYDRHGNVVREIQAVKNASGAVTNYVVTVHEHSVIDVNSIDAEANAATNVNELQYTKEYRPFEVAGPDTAGVRYSRQPDDSELARRVDYIALGAGGAQSPDDPGIGQPDSEIVPLENGDTRVTTYLDYAPHAGPRQVHVEIQHPVPTGQPTQPPPAPTPVSDTFNTYDDHGNLLTSTGPDGWTGYVYSGDPSPTNPSVIERPDLPKGLLLATYRSATPSFGGTPQVTNDYYNEAQADPNNTTQYIPGAVYGKLRSTTDAAGLTRRYTYYADGQQKEVFREWTVAGVLHSVRDSLTEYDDAGRVHVVTDAYGHHTRTEYNALGLVADTFENDNDVNLVRRQTHNDYDAKGNLVRTLYPDGTEVRTAYDDMGRAVWVTDRYKTTSTVSPAGVVTSTDNAAKALATFTAYDALGRVTQTARYKGVVLPLRPDVVGAGAWTAAAPGSGYTRVSVTKTVYDGQSRAVEQVDASGLRTGTVYYSDGRVHQTGPLKPGAPANWYTAADPTESFRRTDDNPPKVLMTTYGYDKTDGLPAGAVSYDTVTDANNHVTTTYKDALGRVIETRYDDATPTFPATSTRTLYGVGDQPVPGHEPDPDHGVPNNPDDSPGQAIEGYQVTKVDQLGKATDSFYDRLGRLTDVWLPAVPDPTQDDPENPGHPLPVRPHWHYAYDANGNQTAQTDPDGHTTTFAYDDHGNRIARTLPDGSRTEHWSYDGFGRVRTHVDFDGQTTWYGYDDSPLHGGRLDAEYRYGSTYDPPLGADPENPAVGQPRYDEKTAYTYDDDPALPVAERLGLGRRAEATDYARNGAGAAQVVHYTHTTYDPVTGGIASVASPEGTVNHTYDPATGQLTRTWTANTDTRYDYDDLGRLWHATAVKLNGSATNLVTTYGYDPVGNLGTVALPNGVVTTNTYDALNRLTQQSVDRGTGLNPPHLTSYFYHLRPDGLRSSVDETSYDNNGQYAGGVHTAWGYDALNRLTSETKAASGQAGYYADTYTFDLAGNRLTKVHDVDETPASPDTATSYNYDPDDRLFQETQLAGKDPSDSASAVLYQTTYGYDNNGSVTSTHRTGAGAADTTSTWDLRNRLKTYTAGPISTAYGYDADGDRVSKVITNSTDPTAPTITSAYSLVDDQNPTGYAQVLEESATPGGAPATTYILGQDVIAQTGTTAANSIAYLGYDGHGSTRFLTDHAGLVTANGHFDYDAFGDRLDANNAGTSLLYAGEYWDAEKGSYYLRGRQAYDPTTGRFTSFDSFEGPSSQPQYLHKYSYGMADPVDNVDPSGRAFEGLAGTLTNIGIRAGINAITFGTIRFAFAKARHLSTGAALREGLNAAGWSALLAVPVVGQLLSGYFLFQTAEGLANGQYDEMGRFELAVDLTASLILGRVGPRLSGSLGAVEEPAPGTQLPIAQRLGILFSRLSRQPKANNPKEALAILSREMKSVEDAYSGVAEDPNPGLNTGGRMYPPRPDNIQGFPDGSWFLKTRGHRLFFNKDGGVTVINRRTGNVDYQEGPRLPVPIYTEDADDN